MVIIAQTEWFKGNIKANASFDFDLWWNRTTIEDAHAHTKAIYRRWRQDTGDSAYIVGCVPAGNEADNQSGRPWVR